MAMDWNRELDLSLAHLIRLQWGTDVWESTARRNISWGAIFIASQWPEGFTRDTLKERWLENFRRWVPREPDEKRANVVNFDVLIELINIRNYSGKPMRRAPIESDVKPVIFEPNKAQPAPISIGQPTPGEMQFLWLPSKPEASLGAPQHSRTGSSESDGFPFPELPALFPVMSTPDDALLGAVGAGCYDQRSIQQSPSSSLLPHTVYHLSHLPVEYAPVEQSSAGDSSSSSSHSKKRRAEPVTTSSGESSPSSVFLAPASPSPPSSYSSPPPPLEDPLLSELLTLMDWPNSVQKPKVRRIRGPSSMTREKHLAKEAERRGMLAEAIEDLGKFVPMPLDEPKPTQVTTLLLVADYGKRIQDVACRLIEENKRLVAAMQGQGSCPAHPTISESTHGSDGYGRDVLRLMMVSCFMVWVFVGTPGLFSASAPNSYQPGDSRHILANNVATSPASVAVTLVLSTLISAGSFAVQGLSIFVVFLAIYVAALLQDMPRVSSERLAAAERLCDWGRENIRSARPDWKQQHLWHLEVLKLVGKPLPSNPVSAGVFFGMQVMRVAMHRIKIGLYIERFLMRALCREKAMLFESNGYNFASFVRPMIQQEEGPPDVSLLSVPMLGCVLAAVANSNVRQQTNDLLYMHSTVAVHLARQSLPVRFFMWLAFSSFAPPSSDPFMSRQSQWAMMHLAREPLQRGQAKEVLELVYNKLQLSSADDGARVGLLGLCGMLYCATRQFDKAFLVHSFALKYQHSSQPIIAVLFMCLSIVQELVALGRTEEARDILRRVESIYALRLSAGDGISIGMAPAEHVALSAARIACMEDRTDFAAMMADAAKMRSCVRLLGLMPVYNLPFLVEAVIERLMPALEIDPKTNFYVAGHRDEIARMVDDLIGEVAKSVHWAQLGEPLEQRLRGWRAFVKGEQEQAMTHFERSLQAAEMVDGLEEQAAHTLTLMSRLGIIRTGSEEVERIVDTLV